MQTWFYPPSFGEIFYSSNNTGQVIRGALGSHGWSYKKACCNANHGHIGSIANQAYRGPVAYIHSLHQRNSQFGKARLQHLLSGF